MVYRKVLLLPWYTAIIIARFVFAIKCKTTSNIALVKDIFIYIESLFSRAKTLNKSIGKKTEKKYAQKPRTNKTLALC